MNESLEWEILPKGAVEVDELATYSGARYSEWQRNWDALAVEHKDPFTHPIWLIAWFAHLARNDVQLFLLRRDGEVVSGIPFSVIPRLTPLGKRCGLIHDDDYLIEGAAIAGAPELIEAAFARLFSTDIPGYGRPLGIRLGKVDATHALVSAGSAQVSPRGARSVVDVHEGFDALLAKVSKNFRGNLRKSRNRLEKLGDVTMETLTQADAFAAGLDRLSALEARSWKGREDSTIGDSPTLSAFLLTALPQFATRSESLVQCLRVGERDIAAQLCLRFGETLHVLKIGYDESEARLSPGNLLLERCIRETCADLAVTRVSLVTLQPWHDKWKPELVGTYCLQWFAPGFPGFIGRMTEVSLRERVKGFLTYCGLRQAPITIPPRNIE